MYILDISNNANCSIISKNIECYLSKNMFMKRREILQFDKWHNNKRNKVKIYITVFQYNHNKNNI